MKKPFKQEIREFLFNIAHYVIEYNVEFQAGQTCGAPGGEKIPISLSTGKYVEGESFRLGY